MLDDTETNERIRKILIYAKDDYEKEPRSTVESGSIATDLLIKETDTDVLLSRMYERGLLNNPYTENDMYRITDFGIRELDTTYNPEYRKKLDEEIKLQKLEEQRKKQEQFNIEEKRHHDNLKWSKWGVIGAIIVGSIGAITGIIALLVTWNM